MRTAELCFCQCYMHSDLNESQNPEFTLNPALHRYIKGPLINHNNSLSFCMVSMRMFTVAFETILLSMHRRMKTYNMSVNILTKLEPRRCNMLIRMGMTNTSWRCIKVCQLYSVMIWTGRIIGMLNATELTELCLWIRICLRCLWQTYPNLSILIQWKSINMKHQYLFYED